MHTTENSSMRSPSSSSNRKGILLALLAASLYAVNSPLSKLLLDYVPSTVMAGLLYLGAGIGMGFVALFRRVRKTPRHEESFGRRDFPFVLAMIVLDMLAPIFLLWGLSMTTAANASLLNNFEIVATALIALCVFRESVSPRLWAGIGFVTASCALLSFEDVAALRIGRGSLLVLAACVCWGIENNCTRRLSGKDPLMIVLLKGIFSGSGSLVIGLCLGERPTSAVAVTATLAVGFVAYGLSIFFYVYAQRMLGAARTGAYYAVAPFIGTGLSLAIFRDPPPATYVAALLLMAVGAALAAEDKPLFPKRRQGSSYEIPAKKETPKN